ncbi:MULTISPECIES: cation:proton antiporter [Staphylococcus]|uniref:Sodium:proton antiporter n=1 Tax=Staphylococcus lugdunensis TaxID=28035 RepID=A0ABX6BQN1_STALU|nr:MULTISPECIES: sodium:proton antiporter [Staphylococcus]ADC86715.1 Na+/H+ antiporter [Staphylococcus lugdunensis HKU09-01]ARJ08456.1 sodium:proton antiporter [Staphylococcus lugdunensis]ARJ15539.1 sodium:proton antiporter [Staphylococcus lugdunensis]ARJ28927.1 sodium:proton antiporter [Staphylococcus lugdunensis]EKS23528.1 Na+/H+ antiporter [Staphylococcus lugdunensis ACS-027-V-Sch2]
MELLEAFLLFITAVIISSIIYNRFPKIPAAFIQIALGVCLFILPIPIHFKFDSEVFMFAVIAPLLFVEGTHVSRTKLMEYKKPIVLMAMALVFATVIGVGYFIHWIWPDLPMPAAFAIAAILCPTDAVAVSAITKGKMLPKGSMAILEGESLLNDAAGIISFKIAVTALVTGSFSAFHAIGQFIVSTILGILIGIIIGTLVVRLRIYLTANKGLKDNNTLTFIQLLTPFVVYFIAEELHASGIIAVVIAGLIHGLERDRLIRAQTELQMNYNQIWTTLSYALNGFVFVVLGFIVPEVVDEIIRVEPENIMFLIGITLSIAVAIYVFRYIWVYIWFKDFYAPKNVQSYLDDDSGSIPTRSRYAFIMTMCGIHGTISLSMALTLPELVGQQQHFEYRNDLLFIAALMVLISLILAQIILPLITPSAHETDFQGMSYQSAKIFIVQQVIDSFKEKSTSQPDIDYRPILNQYFNELSFLLNIEPDNKNTKELRRLEDIAEKIETETLERLIAKGSITKQDISNYRGVIEYSQFFREASFIKKLSRFIKLFYLRLKALKSSDKSERNDIRQKYQDGFKHVQKIMRIVNHNIILKMREEQHSSNVLEVSLVINRYTNLTQTLRQSASKIKARQKNELIVSNETQQSLKLQALYTQRDVLDKLIANNKITNDIAKQIRENINYNEIVLASESTH